MNCADFVFLLLWVWSVSAGHRVCVFRLLQETHRPGPPVHPRGVHTTRVYGPCSRPVCVQGMLFATAECCKTPVELTPVRPTKRRLMSVHTTRVYGLCSRPVCASVLTARVHGPCVRPGHAVCDGRVLQDPGGAGPPVHPRGVHTTRVYGPCSRPVCASRACCSRRPSVARPRWSWSACTSHEA